MPGKITGARVLQLDSSTKRAEGELAAAVKKLEVRLSTSQRHAPSGSLKHIVHDRGVSDVPVNQMALDTLFSCSIALFSLLVSCDRGSIDQRNDCKFTSLQCISTGTHASGRFTDLQPNHVISY
eukprot:scaffold66174_cov49-Prasinocladus_malaysianus.AAC.1